MPHLVRRHTGDGSEVEIVAKPVVGSPAPVQSKGNKGRVRMRGTYVTFTEYWHGEGVIGVMSIADNWKAPELTFIDGFDCMVNAHDVVLERHGVPPLLCDVAAVYADPAALRKAGIIGAGSPCVYSSFAPHFGRDTEPDADDPMNAHCPDQVHTVVQGGDVAVLEYLSDVKRVRSLRPESPNARPGRSNDTA